MKRKERGDYPQMALIDRRTGLPVGPQFRVDPTEMPLRNIPATEVLWKFMDYWKFADLLETSSLFFSRQDLLQDPFEGRIALRKPAAISNSDAAFYKAYGVGPEDGTLHEKMTDQFEVHRQCVFISCWHRNTRENRPMWDAYTTSAESVALVTSAAALYRYVTDDILKSAVRYHGPNFKRSIVFGYNTPSFYKPIEYQFEREFRMLKNMGEEGVNLNNPSDKGRWVPCSLKKIIRRVISHPRASREFKRKVEEILSTHLKSVQREDSCLPR